MSFDRRFSFGSPSRSGYNSDSDDENEPLIFEPGKRYIPKKYFTSNFPTITEAEVETSPTSPKNLLAGPPTVTWFRRLGMSSTQAVVLSTLSVVLSLGIATVTLPMYLSAMTKGGSDVYVGITMAVMWYPIISLMMWLLAKVFINKDLSIIPRSPRLSLFGLGAGLSTGVLLLGYSAHPSRTSTTAQPLVLTLVLPCAALAKMTVHRKGFNRRQLLVLGLQALGVFVALFPSFFSFAGRDRDNDPPWYYVMIYLLSWIIITSTVMQTARVVKRYQDSIITAGLWINIFMLSCCVFLFSTNLIPGLGTADTVPHLLQHAAAGGKCFFQQLPVCQGASLVPRALGFILSASFTPQAILMLTAFTKSTIYLASSLTFITPVATIFWSLFKDWPQFEFSPINNRISFAFIILGLAITMVSMLVFIYLGLEEAKLAERRNRVSVAPVRIGRKELFPTLSRTRRVTYAGSGDLTQATSAPSAIHNFRSAPGVAIATGVAKSPSAASVAHASRARRPGVISLPRSVPKKKGGMTRSSSSPVMMSF